MASSAQLQTMNSAASHTGKAAAAVMLTTSHRASKASKSALPPAAAAAAAAGQVSGAAVQSPPACATALGNSSSQATGVWFYVTMVAQPDYRLPGVACNTGVSASKHEARAAVVQEFARHFGHLMKDIASERDHARPPIGYADFEDEVVFGDSCMDNAAFSYQIATDGSWQTPWELEDIYADAWKQVLGSNK